MGKMRMKNKALQVFAPLVIKMVHLFRRPYVVILNYHQVNDFGEPWEHSAVDIHTFKRQMVFLKKHFLIRRLDELADTAAEKNPVKPIAAVTFDDGYRDFHDTALPILKELGIEASLFLSTDAIENRRLFWWDHVGFLLWNLNEPVDVDGFGKLDPENVTALFDDFVRYLKGIDESVKQSIISRLELSADLASVDADIDRLVMDWDNVRSILADNVLIGAHTHKHAIVSKMGNSEFADDLKVNIALIEENLGIVPRFFAYPNGRPCDYTEDTPGVLESLGITHAFSTDSGFIKLSDFRDSGKYEINRTNVTRTYPGFLARVSGIRSLLRRT